MSCGLSFGGTNDIALTPQTLLFVRCGCRDTKRTYPSTRRICLIRCVCVFVNTRIFFRNRAQNRKFNKFLYLVGTAQDGAVTRCLHTNDEGHSLSHTHSLHFLLFSHSQIHTHLLTHTHFLSFLSHFPSHYPHTLFRLSVNGSDFHFLIFSYITHTYAGCLASPQRHH